MTDSHKDTGYYERPPSKRERDLAKAETWKNKILESLDDYQESGIVEAQDKQDKGEI